MVRTKDQPRLVESGAAGPTLKLRARHAEGTCEVEVRAEATVGDVLRSLEGALGTG